MFATPLARRPNVINRTGPRPPTTAMRPTIKFLAPASSLLKFSSIFVPNSITGVTSFRKISPIGASAIFSSSTDFWNLNIDDAATVPNSLDASAAS